MRGTYRLRLMFRRMRKAWLTAQGLRAARRFPTVEDGRAHGLASPLVVTLTSYPARFPHLESTLRSLLDQRVRADRVELWLTEPDRAALPGGIEALGDHGLRIETCRDLRSYKKLVPALERDPQCNYVTADDDVYYPPDWLADLVDAAHDHPGAVIGARTHMARRQGNGTLEPYQRWELATSRMRAAGKRELLFPTGVGGVLYPPGSLARDTLNEAAFMDLCPHGDDIWFFWMARLAGSAHRRTAGQFDVIEWPGTQEVALQNDNRLASGNDHQIRAMEAQYGPVP